MERSLLCVLAAVASAAQPEGQDRIPPLPELPAPLESPISAFPQMGQGQVAVLRYEELGGQGLAAAAFRQQMLYLKQAGIPVLSLEEFLAWRAGAHPLSGLAVLLTLDEATQNTWDIAHPVLQELGFPYIVFIDGRNLQGKPGFVGLTSLQQAVAEGAAIGSHTMSRPAPAQWQFASLAGDVNARALAEAELGESARCIQARFGRCLALSYPPGCAESIMPGVVAHYGYQVAFGRRGGKVTRLAAPYNLNRYGIRDHASFARAINTGKDSDAESLRRNVASIPSDPRPIGTSSGTPAAQGTAQDLPTHAPAGESVGKPAAPAVEHPSPSAGPTPTTPPTAPPPSGAVSPLPPCGIAFADDEEAEEVEIPLIPQDAQEPSAKTSFALDDSGEWVTRHFDQPLAPREETRVIVLGYHNFSNEKPLSEMRMRTSEFCQQMQYLRDAGISVITMQDFLDWRQGRRQLPARCALITIDDGWKSVWTDAYPVLKAYGYPFTLFLYTRYIDVKGDSMKSEWIRTMQKDGATIGSHSTSHLYPRFWKRYPQGSPEYSQQIQQEIIQSAARLKELFGHCSTYCYPGGYNTPVMVEGVRQAFQAAFTVLEAKVGVEEDPYLVHRYMVFGNDSAIFRRAVNFDNATAAAMRESIAASLPRARAFFPKAFEGAHAEQMSYTASAAPRRAPKKKASPTAAATHAVPASTPPPAQIAVPAEGAAAH